MVMSRFIKISMDTPGDVVFLNVDHVTYISEDRGRAKLHMQDGKDYTTFCSLGEFLQILQSCGVLEEE